VLIRSIDCDGAFTSDTISGPAAFQAPPSLKRARVLGTVTDDGRTVSVQMHWTATGDMERTRNVTRFPGFFGVFEGKSRDAVATGTVVLDGETIVDGTTTNAQIESLEDTNVSESSDT
jgi:hypothetical protein